MTVHDCSPCGHIITGSHASKATKAEESEEECKQLGCWKQAPWLCSDLDLAYSQLLIAQSSNSIRGKIFRICNKVEPKSNCNLGSSLGRCKGDLASDRRESGL